MCSRFDKLEDALYDSIIRPSVRIHTFRRADLEFRIARYEVRFWCFVHVNVYTWIFCFSQPCLRYFVLSQELKSELAVVSDMLHELETFEEVSDDFKVGRGSCDS